MFLCCVLGEQMGASFLRQLGVPLCISWFVFVFGGGGFGRVGLEGWGEGGGGHWSYTVWSNILHSFTVTVFHLSLSHFGDFEV